MVVLPALSRPRISTRTSLRPKRLEKIEEKKTPIREEQALVGSGRAKGRCKQREGEAQRSRMQQQGATQEQGAPLCVGAG